MGGNSSPSADDINKILSSVGIEADSDRVESLLKELEGKDITEVIASGVSKLASVPAGGGAVAASGGELSCLASPACQCNGCIRLFVHAFGIWFRTPLLRSWQCNSSSNLVASGLVTTFMLQSFFCQCAVMHS